MDNKIENLKEYFEKQGGVVMAFLFGSRAKSEGSPHEGSDWDIAVYFKSLTDKIEIEQEFDYPQEQQVLGDCVNILKTDNVDFITLNRASATIADVAIRGIPLVIKDRALWLKFMLRVTSQAIDFRQFVKNYAEIYWRSASLVPEDAVALDKILIFINSEAESLKEYLDLSWQEYQNDDKKRKFVEHTIENIMNAVVDVSKIILSSQKKIIPNTYKEAVRQTGLISPFNQEVSDMLSNWVGLRNVIAHQYLDYRWEKIRNFLENYKPILNSFLNASRKFLEENREK